MRHDEILASVAVLFLAGVLVYLTKIGVLTVGMAANKRNRISANQAVDAAAIEGATGDPGSLIDGPAIYIANTPWPYGAPDGNVMPPNSAGVTLPGAPASDFLGFQTA